jgi:hypothetical protein
MDSLDLFFKKYSYKFDKGYPDINNEKDILLLESLLNKLNINVSLEETALTPSELNKDATFKGGNKVPRIEILIQKIQKGDELELNDGSKFKVINTKEVLSQLQGKTKIDKSITLGIDKDNKTITTSDLKKTADFGGGGGMRGGSELTTKAESAQCIANSIRYSSGEITTEDITDQAIQNSKSNVEITDFNTAADLLKTDKSWLISSVSIANALANQFPGSFIHHRGSAWVQRLNNVVKPLLKGEGVKDLNKWNPADIWMVNSEEINIEWPKTLTEINALLLEKFKSIAMPPNKLLERINATVPLGILISLFFNFISTTIFSGLSPNTFHKPRTEIAEVVLCKFTHCSFPSNQFDGPGLRFCQTCLAS